MDYIDKLNERNQFEENKLFESMNNNQYKIRVINLNWYNNYHSKYVNMGSPYEPKIFYNFLSESLVNDYNLKDYIMNNSNYSSHSIDKINNSFLKYEQTFTHKYMKIKKENEIREDVKNNLRYKIEREKERRKRSYLSDKMKMFLNNTATSTCNFFNLMQLSNQND